MVDTTPQTVGSQFEFGCETYAGYQLCAVVSSTRSLYENLEKCFLKKIAHPNAKAAWRRCICGLYRQALSELRSFEIEELKNAIDVVFVKKLPDGYIDGHNGRYGSLAGYDDLLRWADWECTRWVKENANG